ncbi:MAG: DUF2817 domain-containing protein [Bdellovibrionaceae bacterium]|nr:DUF2817 domain-containing protein [Pseudobdellovibrionaceae bacterium]
MNFILLVFFCEGNAQAAIFDLTLFKETYEESRKAFLSVAGDKAHTFVFKKNQNHELAVDYVYWPAGSTHKTLVLVNSGIHGIEGFVGSAVQRQWLLHLRESPLPPEMGVLMIHGLNPFGFMNQRRVNENNVDLNRNFAIKPSLFSKQNLEYKKIERFLNPKKPIKLNFVSEVSFLLEAARYIFQYSLGTMRQGVLQGQYSSPEGLYFGGDRAQNQRALVDLLLQEWASTYERIFVIDIHTGYGQRGKLHYLAASSADPESIVLKKIFGEHSVDFGQQKDFYLVEGDFVAYCLYRLRNDFRRSAQGLAFEFGTLDSQKTLGSIESLRRMVLENQVWNYRSDTQQDADKIRGLFREMFYPSDPEWRSAALRQAQQGWDQVIRYYSSIQ